MTASPPRATPAPGLVAPCELPADLLEQLSAEMGSGFRYELTKIEKRADGKYNLQITAEKGSDDG